MDPLGRNDMTIVRDFDRTGQVSAGDGDAYEIYTERQWAKGVYRSDADVMSRERYDSLYGEGPNSLANGGTGGGGHDADGFLRLVGVSEEGIALYNKASMENGAEFRMGLMEDGASASEIWREGGDGQSAAEDLHEEKPWIAIDSSDPDAGEDEVVLTGADDVASGPVVETPVQILDPAKLDDGLEDEAPGEMLHRDKGDIDPLQYVEPVALIEVPTQLLDPAKHTVNPDWGGTDGVHTGPMTNGPTGPGEGGVPTIGGRGGDTPITGGGRSETAMDDVAPVQSWDIGEDVEGESLTGLPDLPDEDGADGFDSFDG